MCMLWRNVIKFHVNAIKLQIICVCMGITLSKAENVGVISILRSITLGPIA